LGRSATEKKNPFNTINVQFLYRVLKQKKPSVHRHISYQDRQCKFNVKMSRFRANMAVVEKKNYIF
jgi:hypothetical protein